MATTKLLHRTLLAAVLAVLVAAAGMTPNANATAVMPCQTYRCGGVDILYPFWMDTTGSGSGNGAHCGYPSHRLECRRGTPILRLPSGEYGVRSIDYDGRTVSVYDLHVARNSSCPHVAGRSLRLPPPLSLTRRNSNISFLLDCEYAGIAVDHVLPCLRNGGKESYFFREGHVPAGADRVCEELVMMPVLKKPAADDVVAALRTGFELSWSPADGGACGACEQAGGLCGQRREVERWVFTCIHRASPASNSPGGQTPEGPFLTTRAKAAFSLQAIILLSGAIAIILIQCGCCGEGPGRRERRED